MSTHPHARGVALMIIAAVLWSTAGVFTRLLESAGRWETVFWRSSFCVVGMVVLGLAMYRGEAWRKLVSTGWAGLASGCMWALQFTSFMIALTHTTVANTLLVACLSPLVAAVLARVILRESIPARTWLMIALALAGILVMFGADTGGGRWIGNLIALGVPIGAGLNWVILRKLHAEVDLVPAVLIGALLSALGTLALALPFRASPWDVSVLAGLGFFQLALPCALSVVAARYLSPTELALFALLEVLLGPLWAWLGANETPAPNTFTGGAIVLAALVTEAIARGRAPGDIVRQRAPMTP
jgi:drug/metabolite transporter (DMT)-like permease